jgi:hypothetical protein
MTKSEEDFVMVYESIEQVLKDEFYLVEPATSDIGELTWIEGFLLFLYMFLTNNWDLLEPDK